VILQIAFDERAGRADGFVSNGQSRAKVQTGAHSQALPPKRLSQLFGGPPVSASSPLAASAGRASLLTLPDETCARTQGMLVVNCKCAGAAREFRLDRFDIAHLRRTLFGGAVLAVLVLWLLPELKCHDRLAPILGSERRHDLWSKVYTSNILGGPYSEGICTGKLRAESIGNRPDEFAFFPHGRHVVDNLTKKNQPDRSKINMHEAHEIKYWIKALGVSKEELQRAVDKVGNSAAAVRKQLAV
jgi:uncharacterized protein DUF3606